MRAAGFRALVVEGEVARNDAYRGRRVALTADVGTDGTDGTVLADPARKGRGALHDPPP